MRGLSQRVLRSEDRRILTGHGTYVDDLRRRTCCTPHWRSPFAHARVQGSDVSSAAGSPGVVAVFHG